MEKEIIEIEVDFKSHWNNVYQSKEDNQLGWHEDNPETTMQLVAKCHLKENAKILNVGAGTTTLIDKLVEEGYTNIIANDLSKIALEKLDERIVNLYGYNLNCIVDDLTNPTKLNNVQNVDLWIDRAVLHFFLTEEEQKSYFDLIKNIVSKEGYVLIAVFALDGAEKCSGLPLYRYNTEMLQERLGNDFELIESSLHTYTNPFGDERPYIYTLFKRS